MIDAADDELIRLENVTKTYHIGEIDIPVLKGVSLVIRRGEMVALMGASGSGKSTLMNILGCLDRPTSGEYWLDDCEIGRLPANERAIIRGEKLGFVFQSFNLLARTTSLQNVLMPLDYSTQVATSRAGRPHGQQLLQRVGLADRVHHLPSQMSGGQQQRVAIARSLIIRPLLLLADEPTGNLDSHTSVEILRMFQELNASGITVILVTHDAKVASYAHRTIHVADGLVVEDDRQNDAQAQSTSQPVESVAVQSLQSEISDSARQDPPAQSFRDKVTDALAWLVPPTFTTAIRALRRNMMRSALTTIGIVIGIASIITIVEISQGSSAALQKTMSTMGVHNLLVQSGAASSGGVSFGVGSEKTLTPQDVDEIADQCSSVAAAAPIVQIQAQVVRGNRNWVPMSIYGTTPSYLVVRDWNEMDVGDMFTERDVRGSNKVCVVGSTLAKELFDDESPIGQSIRVKNVSLRIVGVLGRKGANMMGMDQDDIILAPWTTITYRVSGSNTGGASRGETMTTGSSGSSSTKINSLNDLYTDATSLYPQQSESQATNHPQAKRVVHVDTIMAKARSADEVPAAIEQISEVLRERHRLRSDADNDFNIRDMSEMLKAFGSMTSMMGALLTIVAAISLVVGGVGIMNIMLVSVTERTREIGLRMAVGARSHHILRQFLIEAILLCLLGGLAGIGLGRSITTVVWFFLRWPIATSWPAIIAACAVSAGVGIAFGFYPAWKASRLDPIDALRYE